MARGADATPPTATVTSSFAGLTDVDSGELDPPDVQVAAGPGFVVEMVNAAERIWRTSTTAPPQLALTQPLSSLYHSGSDSVTDPRLEYDAPAGRWFASISDVDASSVMLAVSRTSDPTGAWSTYSFRASGCADQPRLGMADGIVVIGADVFANCNSQSAPLIGAELWIVNKQQVLAGAPAPSFTTYGPDSSFSTLAPVQSLSSTATEYVVSVDNPSSSVVHLLTVDGIPPAAVNVQTVASIGISPLQAPPDGQQPSAGFARTSQVATNDDRILDSVWENGKLWFSANTGCTPPGDSFVRACGRVAELSTTAKTLTWNADLGEAGAHIFFPAIRPDGSGNLVVVYGESSATVSPELVATVRAPDGTFTTPTVIAGSAGSHLGDRFGDYFGAGRDPVNPATIWVAGEIGSTVSGGSRGWNTTVASVLVTGGGTPPPVVPPTPTPPRLRAHAASGRAGSVLRLTYTALDDGTNVRTQLTVRNRLSAVVHSATSGKATLQAGRLFSLPWRAGKAGRFTFCVRSVVSTGARSAQSCAIATVK